MGRMFCEPCGGWVLYGHQGSEGKHLHLTVNAKLSGHLSVDRQSNKRKSRGLIRSARYRGSPMSEVYSIL